jgi:hypothetical protein
VGRRLRSNHLISRAGAKDRFVALGDVERIQQALDSVAPAIHGVSRVSGVVEDGPHRGRLPCQTRPVGVPLSVIGRRAWDAPLVQSIGDGAVTDAGASPLEDQNNDRPGLGVRDELLGGVALCGLSSVWVWPVVDNQVAVEGTPPQVLSEDRGLGPHRHLHAPLNRLALNAPQAAKDRHHQFVDVVVWINPATNFWDPELNAVVIESGKS